MDKYQNKHRISSTRLQGYDYGAHGIYFVTICTKNRIHYFGKIIGQKIDNISLVVTRNCASLPCLQPTPIGIIAREYWNEIPQHYPFVKLDEFILMPDHLHGILFFNKPEKKDWTPNQFGVQSQNLPAVIHAYKSSVQRYANQNNIVFAWQSRYDDRIIREERGIDNVRRYIKDNPMNWNNE